MSWALPFMIIPLALLIPCAIVVFFEFWQQRAISNAQLKISKGTSSQIVINELVPSEIQEGEKRVYILNKLLSALPQGFRSQVEGLIELKDDMEDGVVMHYDNTAGKIYINTRLARQLFFDEAGKNVKNEVLLGSFLDHELAHREFANPENRFRFFIHNTFPWLEELLVSYGDAFRPLKTIPSEEIVDNLLREHNAWISDNFGTIFPDGLAGLSQFEIEGRVKDAIQGEGVPAALKELSSFLRMRLIREYFKRKEDSLLKTYDSWIIAKFGEKFPDGLVSLNRSEIEGKVNEAIKVQMPLKI